MRNIKYKFSDKELKALLDKLVVIIDTREQANKHIIEWLDKKKKPYRVEKMDYGDYGCFLPAGSFEGQIRDIYFTNDIVIERKFCIDEIAMNLKDQKTEINEITKEVVELLGKDYLKKVLRYDYNRLRSELLSLNKYNIEFFILIEDLNYDSNIRSGNFRANYEPQTLYNRTKALEREFNTIIRPVHKDYIASEIYNTLRFGVRNIFKNKGFID